MISVENLSKSYGRQLLFDGISFRINARERVGLVGRNGHGKTTLLRLAIGELQPEQGSVQRNGDAVYCPQRTDEGGLARSGSGRARCRR